MGVGVGGVLDARHACSVQGRVQQPIGLLTNHTHTHDTQQPHVSTGALEDAVGVWLGRRLDGLHGAGQRGPHSPHTQGPPSAAVGARREKGVCVRGGERLMGASEWGGRGANLVLGLGLGLLTGPALLQAVIVEAEAVAAVAGA